MTDLELAEICQQSHMSFMGCNNDSEDVHNIIGWDHPSTLQIPQRQAYHYVWELQILNLVSVYQLNTFAFAFPAPSFTRFLLASGSQAKGVDWPMSPMWP